ncbi:MAG TPA: DUF4440 domain-containing protein [Terriglobales bacterium]|jgi:hypothetical protein|nr:DUF4440 domain-containing protein [Terriglobales bacterium]
MRYVAWLWFALSVLVTAQEKPSSAEKEVVNVRKARHEALRNRDAVVWSQFVADDCIFSDEDGVVRTKAKSLEQWEKLPPEYDYDVNPSDYLAHLYGNTAVISLRVSVHEGFNDTDVVTEQRVTETYYKQNGSWLLIAKQWSNLPINFRKPVAVDANAYGDYIGEYEWRPGNVETVVVKDGKLWSQTERTLEYLPAGLDTFFLKEGDLATFTFSRDTQGHVIGYTYHRIDGQEIYVRKIR